MPTEIIDLEVVPYVSCLVSRSGVIYHCEGSIREKAIAECAIALIREKAIDATGESGSVWAEFGVENGTSAGYWHSRLPANGELHLFDSFEGLPEPWLGEPPGSHKAKHIPEFDDSRVVMHVGWFKDTLPVPRTFDFVHIDCDLYSSTKTVLDNISVNDGAVILFDELFGYQGWEDGEYKALMEWDENWEYIFRDNVHRVAIRVRK